MNRVPGILSYTAKSDNPGTVLFCHLPLRCSRKNGKIPLRAYFLRGTGFFDGAGVKEMAPERAGSLSSCRKIAAVQLHHERIQGVLIHSFRQRQMRIGFFQQCRILLCQFKNLRHRRNTHRQPPDPVGREAPAIMRLAAAGTALSSPQPAAQSFTR